MKKIFTLMVLLVAVSLNAEFKRYFDASRKGLDKRVKKGKYVLVLQTKKELDMSGNPKNISWTSETTTKTVTVTDMEGNKTEQEVEETIWTPHLKTTQERANDMRDAFQKRLAAELILYFNSKYNTDEKIGLMDLDKYGTAAQKQVCKSIRDWIHDVQKTDFAARIQAIATAETVEALEAVSMDFSNNDASKPPFTYTDVLLMQ